MARMTKATRALEIDDVFITIDGEFEVWTEPVPSETSNGRLSFLAKDMATHKCFEHQAHPDMMWDIKP